MELKRTQPKRPADQTEDLLEGPGLLALDAHVCRLRLLIYHLCKPASSHARLC